MYLDIYYFILNNLPFTELIWEYGNSSNPNWVHVALNPEAGSRGKRGVKRFDKNGDSYYGKENPKAPLKLQFFLLYLQSKANILNIIVYNILCTNQSDFDILKDYLKDYPVYITMDLGLLSKTDKPTLIVGWEYVKYLPKTKYIK